MLTNDGTDVLVVVGVFGRDVGDALGYSHAAVLSVHGGAFVGGSSIAHRKVVSHIARASLVSARPVGFR
jgi:acetyl esterase/lipase